MLKIWGRTNSVNVQKVLWCCDELGVAYERVDAGREFGIVNTPEYRRNNPNGKIPTIEDGELVLWESNAIVRYLCARHEAGGLWSADPAVRAPLEAWMDWCSTTLWPALEPAFRGLIRTPPAQRDTAEIERALRDSAAAASILDAALARGPYLGGAAFTMADIPVGCAVWRWFALPVEQVIARPEFPRLRAWFDRLGERAPYRTHVMQPLR